MEICVLMGCSCFEDNISPLINPFINKMEKVCQKINYIYLHDKNIDGCIECFSCSQVKYIPGCILNDDMNSIFSTVKEPDLVVFATPINTWFCTPVMKSFMDRLYSCSKKYSETDEGIFLLEGKDIVLLTICGEDIFTGGDLMEVSLKRLAAFAKMNFRGHYSIQDHNGNPVFDPNEVLNLSLIFSQKVLENNNSLIKNK